MFPAAFDYQAPTTLAEALSSLKKHGDDAKVMAGGQSLIPLLKLRFARPEVLVDIGRLPALSSVKRENGHVAIGALVRHVDVERSRDLESWLPMMVEASHWIADPLVRNRGTVVGSVCHADPSGDWGSVMLALGAELVAHSESGERVIPADGFFQGPFTTTLRADEVVTAIRIPMPKGPSGGRLPQARAQGGRLRLGRRGGPGRDGRQQDRTGRHRSDRSGRRPTSRPPPPRRRWRGTSRRTS